MELSRAAFLGSEAPGSQFPTISFHAQGNPIPSYFPKQILGCKSALKWGQNCSDFCFLCGKVGAANPGRRRWDGQGWECLQLHGASETNELEEAFPLPRALTRELPVPSRGQELKNEEERKRDREIHLPLWNSQSRGHLEVIFHRAESCFWPFSRHYSLLKPHRSGCWEVFSLHLHGCWERSVRLGAGLNFHTVVCVLG